MALQEEGWPLGLRLFNERIGLARNGDFSGSVSFSTMLTASPTRSTDSSSDLDTQAKHGLALAHHSLRQDGIDFICHFLLRQSTGSFFRDKSITLGSLIGISSFLELSRRSTRGRILVEPSKDNKKINKLRPWLFSLCSMLSTDAVSVNVAPSLGHYLVAERRAASTHRRNNQCSTIYGPNDFSQVQESNSLFVGGQGAAHSSSTSLGEDCGRESNKALEQSNEYAAPIICCLCR
ncbi:hypothetical protein JHK87_006656 [Glycine soja]|nr:hypothetical protein JHK87_006656 [Glycine soja]